MALAYTFPPHPLITQLTYKALVFYPLVPIEYINIKYQLSILFTHDVLEKYQVMQYKKVYASEL